MLASDPKRLQTTTIIYIRKLIPKDSIKELDEFDAAYADYVHAKVEWSVRNTDETMINLNGTWSRLNKLFRDLDDKYGVRR